MTADTIEGGSPTAAQKEAKDIINEFYQPLGYLGCNVSSGKMWEYAKERAAYHVRGLINVTHSQEIVMSAILKGVANKYCYEYWLSILSEIEKM